MMVYFNLFNFFHACSLGKIYLFSVFSIDTVGFYQNILSINFNINYFQQNSIFILFGLVTVFSLLKYFMPSAIRPVFFIFKSPFSLSVSDVYGKIGLVGSIFFLINFLTGLSFLLFYLNIKLNWDNNIIYQNYEYIFHWMVLVFGFIIINRIIGFLISLVFHKESVFITQTRSDFYILYVIGLFITPLILLYVYTQLFALLYIAIFITLIFWFIRWFRIIKIGLSLNQYSLFHIILYLCALEIIPLGLLVKVGFQFF